MTNSLPRRPASGPATTEVPRRRASDVVGHWRRDVSVRASGWLEIVLAAGRACWLGGAIVAATASGAWADVELGAVGQPIPHHVVRLLNRGREIAITGGFDLGTSAEFATLLATSPAVRTIDLNSFGGRVAEGRQVAKLIRARGLATYTGVVCASACTIAYLGGNPRYLGVRPKLGFHRYSFSGLEPLAGLKGLLVDAVNAWGEQDLVQAGISASFAARVFATPSSGVWIPDVDTLVAAHVVTQVVNEMSFSMHAGEGMRSTDDFIATIAELPDFAALRRAEPATFSRIVAAMRANARGDVTVRDVYAPARASLAAAVAKYQPLADDLTQLQFAALEAEEGEMLSRDHPDACLRVLDRTRPFWDYAGLLAPGMWDRKMALDGRIIDIGAAMLAGVLTPPQPTEQALAAEEAQVWGQVRAAGHDPSAIDRASLSALDQRAQCLTKASFMRSVAALPIAEVGPLMRYLERGR